jgi:hypothetical protein
MFAALIVALAAIEAAEDAVLVAVEPKSDADEPKSVPDPVLRVLAQPSSIHANNVSIKTAPGTKCGERTVVGILVQWIDVRGLNDSRTAFDDAGGLAEVSCGLFVASEVTGCASTERVSGRISDLVGMGR